MPQKIYNDDTDQELLFRASSSDLALGEFVGDYDGELLPDVDVIIKEYKQTAVTLSPHSVAWDDTIKMWVIAVPSSVVTQCGGGTATIAAPGMITATVEFETVIAEVSSIRYLYQMVGVTKNHSFVAYDPITGKKATTLTSPTCKYRINGEAKTSFSPEISGYDVDMRDFTVTIPGSLAQNSYDTIQISISAPEGEADILISVMPNQSTLPAQVWGYAARTLTEYSSGGATAAQIWAYAARTLTDPNSYKADVSGLATASQVSALNNLSPAQVLVQVQSALNTYDAPTKAELDSAVSPLATAAGINSLHNLSNGDILTQVSSALNTYDAPTKAEMDSAFTEIKGSGWTNESLKAIKTALLTEAQVNSQCDASIADAALATAGNLSTAQSNITAIKAITDLLTLAAINSQCDTALADYDAPTKAELDSAVASLASAASIASLNNLSAAQVLAQVQAALNTYDAPTKAELDAAFTQIKGSGWATETLKAIKDGQLTVAQVNAECDQAIADAGIPAAVWASVTRTLTSAGSSGATAQEVWAYATRTLTDPNSYKADVSGLATTSALSTAQSNITAIKAITDLLTLAAINAQCDQAISDAALATASQISALNNISASTVRAQADAALAAYDGPTKAEMDAGLALLAPAAQVSALNNLSPAQVLAQVQSALNTYDAPTKAELDSAVSPLATGAAIAALNNISPAGVRAQVDAGLAAYDAPTKAELDAGVAPLATASQISALNNLSPAQVLAQANSALNSYDAPKKSEMDSAFNEIKGAGWTNETLEAIKTAIDTTPTASEIVAAFDADTIDGTYTRIQVERIIAAVLAGSDNALDAGKSEFVGLDGETIRLKATFTENTRTITERKGD